MTEYNPVGTTEGVEQQETAQQSTNLDDAYGQYQQALRATFDYTRAGRLVDASRSLLEISEWLVGNARELGKGTADFPRCLVSWKGLHFLCSLGCLLGDLEFVCAN